ncbi:YkvA family protein [Candidatus Hodarchaeum mangrovi]
MLEKIQKKAKDLKRKTYTIYLVYRDKRVPFWKRLFLGVVIGYAVSPIDLIPDFIPILGYLDDLILIPLGLYLALKFIPAEIFTECEQIALKEENQQIPLNRTIMLFIILLWIIGLFVIFNWFFGILQVFIKSNL